MAEEPAPSSHQHEQEEPPPTSRICVKNLPKYVDDRRLRDLFAAKGEVTDSKIMRTRDGGSRCFGFVGFRTPAEAEAAVRYFNKSYMDTLRLSVEFAYKFGSGEVPRAWSKYTEGTSAHKKLGAAPKTGGNDVPLGEASKAKKKRRQGQEPALEEADPKLKEFLQVMQPRSKQALWTNDDLLPPGTAATAAKQQQQQQQQEQRQRQQGDLAAAGDGSGSDDEYADLPLQVAAAAAATPNSSSDGGEGSDREGAEEEDGVVRNAAVSDLDYLRSRVKASFDDDDDAFAAGGTSTAAATAAAGGSESEGGEEEEEEEQEEASSSGGSEGEEEAKDLIGGPGSDAEAVDKAGMAAPARQQKGQQRGQQKAGASGDAELDVIFGGGSGSAAGREDSEEAEGEGEEDADMADAELTGSHEEDGGQGEGGGEDEGGRQQAAQGPAVTESDEQAHIADTGRLFVRNLPYTATEAELHQLFEGHGDVSEVHLVLDRASKKSKGFALVQFADPQDAVKAHAELDGSIFQGRLIHILPGKRPPPPPEAAAGDEDDDEGGEEGAGGGKKRAATSSYKEKKEATLKATAGNRAAWNTLFMRADTVADAVAAHYGVSKSELLDRDAGDMAVRMALGETQVIAETKRALGEAGADVAALEEAAAAGGKAAGSRTVPRSDRVLVVKNLPFTASEEELEALFGAIGTLGRLVLPPTRTLALVEYLEAQDARRAFKALAYKRYQAVPLYLEWAPRTIFSSPPPARPASGAAAATLKAPAAASAAATSAAAGSPAPAKAGKASKVSKAAGGKAGGELLTGVAEAQAEEVESSSIFVKNLAWATEDAGLKAHFDAAVSASGGSVRAVKVARRKGPDGKLLSAGFGFVECSSEAAAKAAVKALQASTLDGHKLVLQLSTSRQGGATTEGSSKRKASGTGEGGGLGSSGALPGACKVVVRNVAFEATRKDIMGLFTPFGHINSCRLPRKFDGTHRGFAFVDFATKEEARNAMEAVQGAHLYGRRLVLEWAEEDGGLDELRAKTAAKYKGEEALEGVPEAAQAQRQLKRRKRA